MTAIDQFAQLISTAPREHDSLAIDRSRAAFIDTLAGMFAGSSRPVAQKALAAVKHWGQGESPIVGQAVKLKPPFAAMVNGAAAHALDYAEFDEPANAHPSAVIFPALLALAAERSSGRAVVWIYSTRTSIVYDPLDPDFVEVTFADGSHLRSEIGLPTGSPSKPMGAAARRAKFDECLEPLKTVAHRDDLWALLNCLEQQDNLAAGLEL